MPTHSGNVQGPLRIVPAIISGGGIRALWMGDLETEFMEAIEDDVSLPDIDVLFASHHGRDSGKIPSTWLDEMNPKLVIIGGAPAENLNYYGRYDTITQNSAGDIALDLRGQLRQYLCLVIQLLSELPWRRRAIG